MLVVYDLSYGKQSAPTFFTSPQKFCDQGWDGITVPPVGIFMCEKTKDDANVKQHELLHWGQYHRMGTLGFYGNYIGGWIMAGFSYNRNWMEQEANITTRGTAL